MAQPRLALAALFALALLTAAWAPAAAQEPNAPPLDWRSSLSRDHPLAGRLWSARDGRFVSHGDLGAALARARFVLLGEVHDNPDHHRLQAWGVAAAASGRDGGARPALALEMLNEDRRQALDAFNAKPPGERRTGDLANAVAWEKSGWPPFALYAPVIDAALKAGLPFASASPSRDRARAVSKDAAAALGGAESERLGLARPLGPALAAALGAEVKDAHCGMFPDEALPGMSAVQRFRDAVMADALLAGGERHGAILIAGNGHVRRDRGAPHYLERRGAKPDEILSVMHVEVEDGKADPAAYVPRAPDGAPAADFLWFTPRQERDDPCETMRARRSP